MLPSIALASLKRLRSKRTENAPARTLWEFIPWATPGHREPRHLAPLVNSFLRAVKGERVRCVCHAPPRHAKSETMMHAMCWALLYNPKIRFSYSTYGATFAQKQSRKAREIARRIGLEFASQKLTEWVTTAGGGIIFSGVDGPLTGSGVDIAIIDDPFKNRMEAESPARRSRVNDWFEDVLKTRIEGIRSADASDISTGNGSIFIFMTRWHPGDLVGYVLTGPEAEDWENIHLPAINDNDEALWEERWSIKVMRKLRDNMPPYTWASLYQGRPRNRGEAVFNNVYTYTSLPMLYQKAYGLDLSYSGKTTGDHSAIVEMLRANCGTAEDPDFHYYVTKVRRRQCSVTEFKRECAEMTSTSPGTRVRWYTSTTETGTGELFRPEVNVVPIIAKADKLTRAGPFSVAWNNGKVHVPEKAAWLEEFVNEILGFTGVNDAEDDQVDAADAAFDELAGAVTQGFTTEVTAPDRQSEYQALQM